MAQLSAIEDIDKSLELQAFINNGAAEEAPNEFEFSRLKKALAEGEEEENMRSHEEVMKEARSWLKD